MARPSKEGLDYFPLDVDMASDERVEYLEAKYGLEGFGVLIHLLMAVYRNGYYLPWGEIQIYTTAKRINLPVTTLHDIVNLCITVGLFDINLWETYSILTSHGIQARYIRACDYRKKIKMVKEFCLITPADEIKESRFLYIDAPKAVNLWKNTDSNTVSLRKTTEKPANVERLSPEKTPQNRIEENNISTTTTTPLYSPIDEKEPMMDEELGKVVQAFSDNIHPITPMEFETLQEAMQVFSADRVIEAIARAVDRGKRSMGYVRGILKSWQEEGYDSPGDVGRDKEQERRKSNERGLQSIHRKNQRKQSEDEPSESLKELYANIEYAKKRPKPWEVQRADGD